MHNSLCHNKFETQWNALINKYPDCKNYFIRTLYSCKSSWASYVINRNFTTGIQSTQRVEVCNKVIKDRLTRSSRLAEVVKEIQKTFNNQSKKAMLSEYKNEILTRGMPNIIDEYFSELDKILQEYLTPQILQKQHDQMVHSLCYDVFLYNVWQSLLEIMDNSYQQNMAREDDYNQSQSLFSSLLKTIPHNSVKEVWNVIRHSVQNSEPQHIILLNDGSHLCTCLLLINKGIVCQHFFCVMSYSTNVYFHISLIPHCWYNNNKYNISQENILTYQFVREESELPLLKLLTFQHLVEFKQTHIEQLQGPKQKYRFEMSYAKKALDLAIRANRVEEFVSHLKNFIEVTKNDLFDTQDNTNFISIEDPLHVPHKGQQPNRYKSSGEPSKKARRIVQSTD
ncbi:6509_t:CDS:2 [Cetraspora pellucida]|uniref:6509_t:CDS:1 n=1 Tax=Cetraspora pellucida TaxID=1433469 RepID=A0A9N9EIN8_9GLOM|nr:6509_t:CDS:2 [Cetraspora pellucida]